MKVCEDSNRFESYADENPHKLGVLFIVMNSTRMLKNGIFYTQIGLKRLKMKRSFWLKIEHILMLLT